MNAPFMWRALRLSSEAARLRRELATARAGWTRSAEGWLDAAYRWRDCAELCDGWKARAEILYALVEDREAADEALRAQDGIELWLRSLEEVDP